MKVSACFVDWERDLIVGNLRANSLKEIWESAELNAHRLAHLSGKRKEHKTCGGCGQISHCGPDSIENSLGDIKSKYLKTGQFSDLEETMKKVGYVGSGKLLPIVNLNERQS
jgi:radical SAM protein with 4Fe4S-binding SPASM domain